PPAEPFPFRSHPSAPNDRGNKPACNHLREGRSIENRNETTKKIFTQQPVAGVAVTRRPSALEGPEPSMRPIKQRVGACVLAFPGFLDTWASSLSILCEVTRRLPDTK